MSTPTERFVPHHVVTGSGPGLVFLHGFFMDHRLYDAQVATFADRWTTVAIDARGHGGTPHGSTPYTYWDQADDVVAVMDEVGLDRAVVVGHSQGGFTALRLASAHPDRVRALVLIATEAGPSPVPEREAYRQTFSAWDAHGPVPEIAEPLAQALVGGDEAAVWIERWRERAGLPIAPAGDCLLDRDDATGLLDDIHVPALHIRGSEDHGIPADRAASLVTGLPGMTALVTIPGAAHSPQFTHPDVVTAAMGAFLDRLDP